MSRPILTFIFFFIALGLGFGLVLPKYQSLKVIREEIKNRSIELQNKTEYFEQVKTISRQLEEFREELSKISSALPSDPSLPSLFDFLQKTASQTGLVLEEISLGGIKTRETGKETGEVELKDALAGTKEIYLDLKLAGTYPSFKDFLSAIEGSARIIQVQQISLSSPTKPEAAPSFELKIKTQSY